MSTQSYSKLYKKKIGFITYFYKLVEKDHEPFLEKIPYDSSKIFYELPSEITIPNTNEKYKIIGQDEDLKLVNISSRRSTKSQFQSGETQENELKLSIQMKKMANDLERLNKEKQILENQLNCKITMLEELQRKEQEQELTIKQLSDENKQLQKEISKQQSPHNKDIQLLDDETINDIEKIEKIGSGGGGEVFKVFKKEIYAMKEMDINKSDIKSFQHFIGEYEIINMLHHPNIIKTFGIHMSSISIPPTILLEYCPTNLQTAIEDKKFSNEQIVESIYQIAEGMKYIHFKNIIHRDLKPTNILIASDGTIKICDFGISKLISNDEKTMTLGTGTLQYMAPEIINEEEYYDSKVDVYSFGIVLFFILSGGQLPKIKIFDIPKGKKAPIPPSFTEFSKQLINDCWNLEAKDRPSFKIILERLATNHYNLINLSDYEIKNVESFVKQHKLKIPKYE